MKYHITYKVDPSHTQGLEKEELPEGKGACTAIVIGSLLYPPDGSYSAMFVSKDGRTDKELTDDELFKAWVALTARLESSPGLGAGKRGLCRRVMEVLRDVMRPIN